MKKFMPVIPAGLLLALFPLSGKALADDVPTFVIPNESPGYQIDQLIAAGHAQH